MEYTPEAPPAEHRSPRRESASVPVEAPSLAPTSEVRTDPASERAITAGVRRAVMADPSLSLGAKRVEIITTGGKVTLRGRVSGERERTILIRCARSQSGVVEVDDRLEAD